MIFETVTTIVYIIYIHVVVWFSLQQSQELENTSHNVTSILCLLAQCTANEERETTTRSHECSIECTRVRDDHRVNIDKLHF